MCTDIGDSYVYSFDFDDFEAGEVTATRWPCKYAVTGDWVCRAVSDAEALELAKVAAREVWAAPEARAPEQLNVNFITHRSARDDEA